ncbi:hypothetical protein SO802_007914 [Lithocarpus litseifolius]|uniref:NOTCH1 EGF-like calcium-binding domain-containing protein n=1 Tax=Lithocarpus litseifolius TaxID=425828 RepID=A0AAW2DQX1_9ROSI
MAFTVTFVWDFNPCGYAFVVEQGRFNFSSNFLKNIPNETLLVVLDWAIGNEKCGKVAQNKIKIACKGKSKCYDLYTKSGYQCKCEQAYEGNQFFHDSCQDINECELSSLHNCTSAKNCVNIIGCSTCHCPKWYLVEGRKDGEGSVANTLPLFKIVLGK